MLIDVAALDDLEHGKPRILSVDGREIGLIRWGDEVHAVRNICPHQFGPVCRGHTMPLITGDLAGNRFAHPDRPVLVCPWHGWEFDIASGVAAWGDRPYRYKLKTYPVAIEDGRVLVDVGRGAPGRPAPQPATAER